MNSHPASRFAHLVGSTPFSSAGEAMDAALDQFPGQLRTLPDGETGERRNWILHIIESFRSHPDFVLKKDGAWTNYKDLPVFGVRRGRRLRGEGLDFGHVAAFEASYPLFVERRRDRDLDPLAYQAGIPSAFGMALFTMGPVGPFLHRRPFFDATVREIREIHQRAGDDVVFQLELPPELIFVAQMPGPLQGAMARYMARTVVAMVRHSPIGARFGLHLCLGDMNHRALGRLRDVGPLVKLSNAIVAAWPEGRSLEFIHAPLAAAVLPPATDPAFYAPLRGLRLPDETRFIAGFAHEEQSLDEQRKLLSLIESLVGRPVDIASSCGLGRRTREQARAAMERTAALVRS